MEGTVLNNFSFKKCITRGVLISLCVAVGSGIVQLALELFKRNGLELINEAIYYVFSGITMTAASLALMLFLRRIPRTAYVRRMFTILVVVMIATIWMTVYMWMPYLPYHYATCENAGNKVAIMRHFTLNEEISARLNEASAAYMAEAEAAAAEAQANGEAVEEVPNTVTDTELLCSYAAYPVKMGIFFDTNADIEGNVYTLFGATSVTIRIDWPQDNVAHLYVEGAEGEGESTTTLD